MLKRALPPIGAQNEPAVAASPNDLQRGDGVVPKKISTRHDRVVYKVEPLAADPSVPPRATSVPLRRGSHASTEHGAGKRIHGRRGVPTKVPKSIQTFIGGNSPGSRNRNVTNAEMSAEQSDPTLRKIMAWQKSMESEESTFASVFTWCELAYRKVCAETEKERKPNPLRTAVSSMLMDKLIAHTPSDSQELMTKLLHELYASIYYEFEEYMSREDLPPIARAGSNRSSMVGSLSRSNSNGSMSVAASKEKQLLAELSHSDTASLGLSQQQPAVSHKMLAVSLHRRSTFFQSLFDLQKRRVEVHGRPVRVVSMTVDVWRRKLLRICLASWIGFISERKSRWHKITSVMTNNRKKKSRIALVAHFSAWRTYVFERRHQCRVVYEENSRVKLVHRMGRRIKELEEENERLHKQFDELLDDHMFVGKQLHRLEDLFTKFKTEITPEQEGFVAFPPSSQATPAATNLEMSLKTASATHNASTSLRLAESTLTGGVSSHTRSAGNHEDAQTAEFNAIYEHTDRVVLGGPQPASPKRAPSAENGEPPREPTAAELQEVFHSQKDATTALESVTTKMTDLGTYLELTTKELIGSEDEAEQPPAEGAGTPQSPGKGEGAGSGAASPRMNQPSGTPTEGAAQPDGTASDPDAAPSSDIATARGEKTATPAAEEESVVEKIRKRRVQIKADDDPSTIEARADVQKHKKALSYRDVLDWVNLRTQLILHNSKTTVRRCNNFTLDFKDSTRLAYLLVSLGAEKTLIDEVFGTTNLVERATMVCDIAKCFFEPTDEPFFAVPIEPIDVAKGKGAKISKLLFGLYEKYSNIPLVMQNTPLNPRLSRALRRASSMNSHGSSNQLTSVTETDAPEGLQRKESTATGMMQESVLGSADENEYEIFGNERPLPDSQYMAWYRDLAGEDSDVDEVADYFEEMSRRKSDAEAVMYRMQKRMTMYMRRASEDPSGAARDAKGRKKRKTQRVRNVGGRKLVFDDRIAPEANMLQWVHDKLSISGEGTTESVDKDITSLSNIEMLEKLVHSLEPESRLASANDTKTRADALQRILRNKMHVKNVKVRSTIGTEEEAVSLKQLITALYVMDKSGVVLV